MFSLENTLPAVHEIQELLGEDAVNSDDEVLLPIAATYPESAQETADIVKICFKYKVPMSRCHET
ncbi:hypothetical protein BDZ91DRAFT_719993 [Kalaharituber pfeilii]|nr:hypothetical protein BDZ91DRAFT_719993 [Kalaharituber pfeilii]